MNIPFRYVQATFLLVSIFCLPTLSVRADNWAQWRGAGHTSVSAETNLLENWSDEQKPVWKYDLPGPGGASPIVWEDKIFVSCVVGAGDNGDELALVCVSTNGKLLWSKGLEGKNKNSRDGGNSASPSPCTDGEHVWIMPGNGVLHCFDMDGNLLWKKHLQAEYGKFEIQFGMTSTPILDKGKLYVQLIHGKMARGNTEPSRGWIIAFDAKSGKEIWKHERKTDGTFENKHSYASPTIYRDNDREFLLTHGGDYVIAHSLTDGSEIWRCGGMNPKGDGYNMFLRFVASPVCSNGLIVVPTAKSGPVLGIAADQELVGDITDKNKAFRWRMDRGTPDVATPVAYRGRIYMARENGVLLVVDEKTGEQIFQKRLFGDRHRSTPVAACGKLFVTGRNGKFVVLDVESEPKLLASIDLKDQMFASPAIANGLVFVRTTNAMFAFGKQVK